MHITFYTKLNVINFDKCYLIYETWDTGNLIT